MTLSDSQFFTAVENGELETFTHHDHLRLAWIVLQEHRLTIAIDTLCKLFRNYATSKGAPEVFHETITWAFVVIIHERMQRGLGGHTYQEFFSLNPDLSRGKSILYDYYGPELLDDEFARKTFVLPQARPSVPME